MGTVVIYYPASDATLGLNTVAPGATHYTAIDETTEDDADYVGQVGTGTNCDYYTLKDGAGAAPAIPTGSTINTVTPYCAGMVAGPFSGTCFFGPGLSDGAHLSTLASPYTDAGWTAHNIAFGNAPDGGAWTAEKVNALQLVAQCKGAIKGSRAYISWLNLHVDYDPPAPTIKGAVLLIGED